MGGRVGKILLPLVALAGVGIATGGFGLGAAGAAGAGTGAAGGTIAGAGGFLNTSALSLASASLPGTIVPTAGGFLNTSALSLLPTAAAPTIAPVAASSGGFFGSLFSKLASNPFGALSSGLNAISSARSVSAQRQVLALQEQGLVLAGARDRLGIATRLNRSQRNLGRSLASIAVSPFGGAQQAQLATAASSLAARESGLLAAEESLAVQSGASRIAQLRARRRGAARPGEVARQFLSIGRDLFESVG